MSYSVSHWSGRLGNNIQQVANCIMSAKFNNQEFVQTLDHDIISKFVISFGDGNANASGRFYAWEPLVHCEKGCLEGGNEIGITKEHVYENMHETCKKFVSPFLALPKKEVIGDETIVMHLRSGDNYHRIFDPPTNYIPNPLIYYLNLIDSFEKVADDFATLMNAKNVALSGVGTFAMAAALCSSVLENLFTTDLLLTEHLNYSMLLNTSVNVHVMELENYLSVFPCSWRNTEEQRKFILEYK